jgi:hypothetical protein
MNVTIRLIKPGKNKIVTYEAAVLERNDTYALVHARWNRPDVDLGYVVFSTGDNFYEHFYTERWYNVYEIRSEAGGLKGWYCNVSRPAVFEETTIASEDLEIDVFVSADRLTLLVLDEDEFEARGLERSDPDAHRAALAAVDEICRLARRGEGPFDR